MDEYNDPIINKIKSSVPFTVYVECESYPDVEFSIFFEKVADKDMIVKCVSALEGYMYRYNKFHFLRPIHYVSDIDSLPDAASLFSVSVHVDFGNANPKALIGAVKAVSDTQLPITRIVLE